MEGSSYHVQWLPVLDVAIGTKKTLIVCRLHFLLKGESAQVQQDGRLWIHRSYRQWKRDSFPGWSINTIRQSLSDLETKGLILVGNFNKAGYDQTKWYSLSYEMLSQLDPSLCPEGSTFAEN